MKPNTNAETNTNAAIVIAQLAFCNSVISTSSLVFPAWFKV